jgi:addiction module HigA family antidote
MRKKIFVNEGGVNGAGIGGVDSESEEFQLMLATMREQASKRTPQQNSELELSGIHFRMGRYLLGEQLPLKPNDIPSLLSEAIQALDSKQKDFANYIGIAPSNLSAILKGRRPISPELALQFEEIFSIPATLWLGVQTKNELELLRQKRASVVQLSLADLYAKYPPKHSAKVKSMNAFKAKKHEPTRKATGQ